MNFIPIQIITTKINFIFSLHQIPPNVSPILYSILLSLFKTTNIIYPPHIVFHILRYHFHVPGSSLQYNYVPDYVGLVHIPFPGGLYVKLGNNYAEVLSVGYNGHICCYFGFMCSCITTDKSIIMTYASVVSSTKTAISSLNKTLLT